LILLKETNKPVYISHHYLLHKDPKQVDNGNLNPDAQPFKPDHEGATGMGKSNQIGAISAGNAGTANVPNLKRSKCQ
jgi:hypothetical protein